MINLKCNAWHCASNKDNMCKLKNIELNFNWDNEGYGCYCSCFNETKEYKRSFYEIKPYKDGFIVIQTNCIESPYNYIKDIIEDIKASYPYKNKITLIFDTLIGCYTARDSNRFITVNYICDNDDIDEYKVLNIPRSDSDGQDIMKITCDYFRNEYKLSQNNIDSFMSKESAELILKGLNI